MLVKTVQEGQFMVRADVSQHKGRYRDQIKNINATIDTFVSHFDAIPSPVMVIDKEFTIRYMNEAGAQVSGKSKEELVGVKCYDIFCTGDCGTENCACMLAMRDKEKHNSETDAHPAGKDMVIRYMGSPIISNGEVVAPSRLSPI